VSKPSEHPAEALSGTYRPNARGQIESVSNDCCCTLGFVGCEVSVRQPGQVQGLVARVRVVVPPESIPQDRDCTGVVLQLGQATSRHDVHLETVDPEDVVGLGR
jgi:hypothetical protein